MGQYIYLQFKIFLYGVWTYILSARSFALRPPPFSERRFACMCVYLPPVYLIFVILILLFLVTDAPAPVGPGPVHSVTVKPDTVETVTGFSGTETGG